MALFCPSIMVASFACYQTDLDKESKIREKIRDIVKDLHQISREASNVLQVIHYRIEDIPAACQEARVLFEKAKPEYQKLRELVPEDEYFRYYEQWKIVTQQFSYLVSLVVWLEIGTHAQVGTIAEILGMDMEEGITGFHLDIEDYLLGLTNLCSELARLAVTSVTNHEYNRPVQISGFIMELTAGFRLLNLKNDFLRKRFDSMKYEVKKVEEVVYDLSIRGLLPSADR